MRGKLDNLTKAISLLEIGCYVFPAEVRVDGTKHPLTKKGHLDASNDVEVVAQWFQNNFPNAVVAVHAGRSGLNVLDRDIKHDDEGNETVNGFHALQDKWLIPEETFNYKSVNGHGQHDIYLAPENVVLGGASKYRKLLGVDRRAGSSWFIWAGDTVPDSREAFAPAPEWLCDPSVIQTGEGFEGTVDEWIDSLVAGEPNLLVRKALERIPENMSHSEMAERQFNAVRLGAEGAPGVPHLLASLREAWLNRPEETHTTPKDQWPWKFEEALSRAISMFGASVERIENLPEFNLSELSSKMNTAALVGEPQDSFHFSKVLNELHNVELTDEERASIMWNAPTTKTLAREWGIDFLYERIEKSRKTPEPERENPGLDVAREVAPDGRVLLLSEAEHTYISCRPTFADNYLKAAQQMGFANPVYTYTSGWTVASMWFAFKGFIPASDVDKMGMNLWTIQIGESGTGKTRMEKWERANLGALFNGDNGDKPPYHTGGDTSPQGLHAHLLERDRKPTILIQDEASSFFADVKEKSWMKTLSDSSARWYEGYVESTSKLNAKELRGKTALTSFHVSMMATPDRFFGLIDDDLFLSGFLARVNWTLAPPAKVTDDMFEVRESENPSDATIDGVPEEVQGLATDLVSASRLVGSTPKPITSTQESKDRIKAAHKKMYESAQTHPRWGIIEPSVKRLAETLRKCAAISAMYRGDTVIRLDDTLHAVKAVEMWFNYLLQVVDLVAQGTFQKLCNDMENYVRTAKEPTETKILYTFRNRVVRDPRELSTALQFLVSSGRVNLKEEGGKVARYTINGGL